MFITKSEHEKLKNENSSLQAAVDSATAVLNTLRTAFNLTDDSTEQEIMDHAGELISENDTLNAALTQMESDHAAAIATLNDDLQAANARIQELENGDADDPTLRGKEKDNIQDIAGEKDSSKFAHNKAADKYFGKKTT